VCCQKSTAPVTSGAATAAKTGASGGTATGTTAGTAGGSLITAKTYGYNPPITGTIPTIIGKVIRQLLSVVGALMLAMFFWGGFLWITAGGDEGAVKKARAVLSSAFIGMVIIVASYVIVMNVVALLGKAAFGG